MCINLKSDNNLMMHRGFTLVEMAIVLIIFGLFLSATLVPLSAQRDLSDYKTARSDLEQIKEALYGFAIANGRLPCPPSSTSNGLESPPPCAGNLAAGDIPWATLGTPRTDPWSNPYHYRVDSSFAQASPLFNLTTTATNLKVYSDSSKIGYIANGVSAVIYSSGKNGAIQPPVSADELENATITTVATYDNNFVSHDITQDFDDIVTWIPVTVLFNKMVSAQKLP